MEYLKDYITERIRIDNIKPLSGPIKPDTPYGLPDDPLWEWRIRKQIYQSVNNRDHPWKYMVVVGSNKRYTTLMFWNPDFDWIPYITAQMCTHANPNPAIIMVDQKIFFDPDFETSLKNFWEKSPSSFKFKSVEVPDEIHYSNEVNDIIEQFKKEYC